MKKIFFCTPVFHGYETQIINELQNQGYQVEYCDYPSFITENRKYKNIIERLVNNIYFKRLKKIDLREERATKLFEDKLLKKSKECEYFIKIGPIILKERTLELIKNNFKKKISHHWDSIGKYHSKIDLFNEKRYFNKVTSYDKNDCIEYNLSYLPNYYKNRKSSEKIFNRVYTIMSDITKIKTLEKIAEKLKNNIDETEIILVTKNKEIKSDKITILKESIPLEIVLKKINESKIILELNREKNKGYTFRTFDCIGMKKKLITNNKDIVNEDFYNPNNILVIDENNIDIPKEFIDSPYEDLSKEIYEKYSLENWIKQLLR